MIRWTAKTDEKLAWAPEIGDMLAYMFLVPPADRLAIIVQIAAEVMSCSRCCIILEKGGNSGRDKKLFLVAGFPMEGHNIGEEILPQYGKEFLKKIIKQGNQLFIQYSKKDERVAYMRSSIEHYKIKAQLFVTLYYKKVRGGHAIDPFGVMIFDSTDEDQERFQTAAYTVNKIVKVVVAILLNEQRRTSMDYELMKATYINALGDHSMGFQDGLRNPFTSLEAFAKKLNHLMSQLKEEVSGNKKIEKAAEYVSILTEEIDQIKSRTDDFLSTIKFRVSDLVIREYDLQDFIRNLASEFSAKKKKDQADMGVILDFKRLSRTRVKFDYAHMKKCLIIIMDNAARTGAKNIWIRAFNRNTAADKGSVIITVSNDGQKMSQVMSSQIFMLFSGIGYGKEMEGLAIVDSIIKAHKGEIKLISEPKTQYIITLTQ